MSESPTWIMVVAPVALIVLLSIAGLMLALLFNPRTRPAALFLLVGGGILGIGLLFALWGVSLAPSHGPVPSPVISDSYVVESPNGWEAGHGAWQGETQYASSQTTRHKSWGFGIIGAPVLLAVALLVLGLIKHRPAALPVIGLLGLGLVGFVFVTSRSVERVPGEVVAEVTIPTPTYSGGYDHSGQATVAEAYDPMLEEQIPLTAEAPAPPGAAVPANGAHEAAAEPRAVEEVPQVEELPNWADLLEASYSPLPPADDAPAPQVADEAVESKPAEAPLEAMAASAGVSEPQIAAALDTSSAPPQEVLHWIHKPSEHVGNVVRRVVSEGPHATADVAYERVQPKISATVRDYLREVLVEEGHVGAEVPALGDLGITPRWIRENVVTDEYYQTTETSVASGMQTVFVRLEFTPHTTDALVEAWQVNARQDRVSTVGLVASSLLATMGGLWGLIKLDTATKGYYTKRLFIGVPLAIIGGLTLLGLFGP